MAWNFREHELEEQLRTLRQQLFTKDQALATLNDQLLKRNEELETTKTSLDETQYKLRHEADNVVRLEDELSRRNVELQNERLNRENAEMAQRNLHNELKQGDSSTKDLNSIIGRLSHELDTSNAQLKNVTSEKAKLEIRISEMEVLLHRKETMPPLPPKRVGGRPRASSLTHLNVASMEKDLESIRASSKSYQVELESTKAKMSRMQDDLVKVENAKLVLEKQLAESEARLRTALEESEERQRELSYLQVQSGSAEREEQLLARLEEEEKKVELLTSELSAASRSKGGELKRSMERLQTQLNAESSKVARLEEQEIQLTQEREEALNERDDALAKAEELSSLVAEKARAVGELREVVRGLRDELDARPTLPSSEVNTESISKMLAAIERLRTQRDDLQTSMEYLQAESQFTIQSLREKLAAKEQEKARSIDEDRMDEDVPVAANEQLEQVTRDLAVQHDLVAKLQEECKALRAQLQADAEAYAQNLTDVMREKTELAESKDTEVKSLEDRILDLSDSLNSISAERDSLSTQSQKLQVDVQSLQHEIRDYELRLHSAQTSRSPAPSFNASQQALAKQVEDLEARVLRRNEQIGVLQHDIKRLETNLRLAEDRVGEMSSELEMANTEKTAMLDDCATAREEREAMRKAKDAIEIELDEMTKQLSEKSTEVCILQGSIKTLEDAAVQIDESRLDEIAVLVSIVADRQAQLRSVVAKLEVERRQHALTTEDSKSTLTDSAACESAMLEDVCMKSVGVEDPIIEQLETEKAKLLVSTIPSMERDALIELINASKLEELEVARFAMLHDVRLSLHEKRGGSKPSEADEEAELHRQSYLAVLRALGNEYSRMEGELEARAQKTEVQFDAVRTERSSLELQIETMKQEIAGLQSSLDGTSDEHQRAIDALVSDKSSLEQRLSALHGELESLKKTLEDEVEGRGSDRASFDAELKAVVEKNERLVDSEAALQRELEQHRTEAEDLHVKLEQIQAENSQIRTEMEELAGETQRANSKSQCLEQQLRSNEETISNLKQQLMAARENLSRSEKSSKAAEMNLQLAITQHDRTIANLRQQLKDFDEDRTRILQLQQTVAELKEEIEEKDELLRRKCDEIEANDDKAIAMLKESKKLQRTIESLTKKNASLHKKLEKAEKANESSSAPSSSAGPSVTRAKSPSPKAAPSPNSTAPTELRAHQTETPMHVAAHLQRTFTPPAPAPTVSRRIDPEPASINVFTPTLPQDVSVPRTPAHAQLQPHDVITASTSAGKKRPAPDDFYPNEPLPAQPIIVEAVTPRPRKPLRTLKTGFTPVRGMGSSSSRPMLGQPSPIRRNGSQATERTISDVTNSSLKRSSAAQPSAGWLGKLRGSTSKRLAQSEDSS